MSKTNKNISSTVKTKLTITSDQLKKAIDKVKEREVKNVTIKGFRKGKAPAALAEKLLDSEKITQLALSNIVPALLEEKLLQEKEQSGRTRVIVVDDPHYHFENFNPQANSDAIIEASVDLYPEVYTGAILQELSLKKADPVPVTEEKVQEFIDNLKNNFAKISEKNQKEPTEDELLRVLKVESMDALIERTRQELEQEAVYQSEQEFEQNLINTLVNTTEIDVPKALVNREVARIVQAMQQQLQRLGTNIENYIQSQGKSEEEWQSDLLKQATDNVKSMLILTELTQDMEITLTENEIQEIQKSGTQEQQDTYALMLRQRKALDQLKLLVSSR